MFLPQKGMRCLTREEGRCDVTVGPDGKDKMKIRAACMRECGWNNPAQITRRVSKASSVRFPLFALVVCIYWMEIRQIGGLIMRIPFHRPSSLKIRAADEPPPILHSVLHKFSPLSASNHTTINNRERNPTFPPPVLTRSSCCCPFYFFVLSALFLRAVGLIRFCCPFYTFSTWRITSRDSRGQGKIKS